MKDNLIGKKFNKLLVISFYDIDNRTFTLGL